MVFNNLTDKISPFVLDEKYHPYDIPTFKTKDWGGSNELFKSTTNKYMMYDFYVLDYLKFLVDNMSPKQFRDLNPDLEASVQDAVKKLFPHLREELLDAVFYSICAEIRNSTQIGETTNLHELPMGSKERKIYSDWLKYMKVYRGAYTQDDLEVLDVDKPSSEVRPPELEKTNSKDRNLSYKAANYAIKKNGASRADFVRMATELFEKGKWSASYGGQAWANIGKGWSTLNESDELTPRTKQAIDSLKKPMSVAIDHVYDLQHNTDTVFNKLKSYYDPGSGYSWLKKALDDKANVKSYHDLIEDTSGAVKSMALPILYNRLGVSWQEHLKTHRPEDLYDRAEEEKKQKEYDEIQKQKHEQLQKLLTQIKAKKGIDTPTRNVKFETVSPSNTKVGDIVICIDNAGMHKKITFEQEYVVKKIENSTIAIIDDNGKLINTFQYRFKTTGLTSQEAVEPEKLFTPEEMSTFSDVSVYNTKVGDDVIVYSNKTVEKFLTIGKMYKVKEINSHVVQIKDNSGEYHSYSLSRFKTNNVHQSKAAEYSTWKKGDLLKCVNDTGNAEGKLVVGTIYVAAEDAYAAKGSPSYLIKINNKRGKYLGPFNTDRFLNTSKAKDDAKAALGKMADDISKGSLTPKTPEFEFAIGDKVKRKGDENMQGTVYDVFIGPDGSPGVEVKLLDGSKVRWKASNTIKVYSGEDHPTNKNSQVGDVVLCIDDSKSTRSITKGKRYTIQGFSHGLIIILDDIGKNSWYSNDRFTIIDEDDKEPEPAPVYKYAKGDKVIYTSMEGKEFNGVVISVRPSKHSDMVLVNIKFDDIANEVNYSEHNPQLRKASDEEEPPFNPTKENNSPYKVGDYVVYTTDEPKRYNGTVEDITTSNNITLLKVHFKELDEFIHINATDPQLRKVPSFKQKFENENLEMGDDVIATTDDGDELFGNIGLFNTAKTKAWVDVPTVSGFTKSSWFPISQIKKDTKI